MFSVKFSQIERTKVISGLARNSFESVHSPNYCSTSKDCSLYSSPLRVFIVTVLLEVLHSQGEGEILDFICIVI